MPFDKTAQGTLSTARAAALSDLWGDLTALPPGPDWTPEEVGEQLVEALRWARHAAGRTGPGGMSTIRLPFIPTLEAHLDEGWGLPERADDPEDAVLRLPTSPALVSRHMAALQWQASYLVPAHVGSSRVLGLWLRCRVSRRSFDAAIKDWPHLSRANAYRLRDRGLSLIAQGLTRDRVRVEVD